VSGELPIPVGIGLINRDGSYLIRKRPPLPGSPMPGLWEFPGGKCEPGETPADAAIRECREETGILVAIVRLRDSREHRYSHGHVQLNYFDCRPLDDQAEPTGGFVWVPATELLDREFPEANGPILRELANEAASPQNAKSSLGARPS
jgi:mutator protein MutT